MKTHFYKNRVLALNSAYFSDSLLNEIVIVTRPHIPATVLHIDN